ncbi:MAG: IPT/TIG domain-containing protein, partial [Planctomycetes bacterium]|nr:IPT/TIG domain-containing protein [Planctomycetota bacterium]
YYLVATDGISSVYSGTPLVPHSVTVTNQPTLASVSPNNGPAAGGTPVSLAGTLFQEGASVLFGDVLASNTVVLSANQITCVTPPHFPAMVDVKVVNPDSTQATLLNAFGYEDTSVVLSMPNTSADYGTIVQLDLSAANVVGLRAADLTITFTSGVLAAQGATTGTLTVGWSLSANTATPGTVRLSLASATTVSGSGSLARVNFNVVGVPPASTALTISSATLNDGAITPGLSHGSFDVNGFFTVSGTVNYFVSRPVPGVTLTMAGGGTYSAVSDTSGQYSLADVPTGTYTLTPTKSDDVAEITAYDASLVLQAAAGLRTLTANERTAADVNRNSVVSSMDASYILEKSVDLIQVPFPGAGIVWAFDPTQRPYAPLNSNRTAQNFTAVLLGDVSGNWQPGMDLALPAGGDPKVPSATSASLSLADVSGQLGAEAVLPLYLDLQEAALYAVDLVLSYDPTKLSAGTVSLGSAAQGMMMAVNTQTPGAIHIGLAGADPVTAGGALLEIPFAVLGVSTSPIPVAFQRAVLNEGQIPANLDDGSVTILFSSADFDRDGDVDADDFEQFVSCASGPAVALESGCEAKDFDGDGDADQSDFGFFQRCYSGANVAANPGCAN